MTACHHRVIATVNVNVNVNATATATVTAIATTLHAIWTSVGPVAILEKAPSPLDRLTHPRTSPLAPVVSAAAMLREGELEETLDIEVVVEDGLR